MEYIFKMEDGEYWWNGYSAVLDFTKKCDCDLLDGQLHELMDKIGIDGFKFDGGTLQTYSSSAIKNGSVAEDFTPAERNIAWNEFGMRYKYHEYMVVSFILP